jgi:hypothetical protein
MAFGKRQQPPPPPEAAPENPEPAPSLAPDPVAPFKAESPDDYVHCFEPAKELVKILMEAYGGSGGRVHAETILGAAAALTGEFALRSTGLPLPVKGLVFGDAINDVLYEGAAHGRMTIWSFFAQAARGAGLAESELPDVIDVFRRVVGAIGSSNFPPLSVPRNNYPHEWSPNAAPRLRHKVIAIADRHGLSLRDTAFALAIATSLLMSTTRDVLAPAIAIRLVTEICFSVAKMAPLTEPIGE